MIKINLIDWRAKRRFVANNRYFFILAVVVLTSALLTASSNLFIRYMISEDESSIAYLDSEISKLRPDLDKINSIEKQRETLLKRRKVVEDLQKSRVFLVNVWNDIVRSVPDGIVLNEINGKGNELNLIGVGANNASIATLLQNFEKLPWVNDAKLGELKSSNKESANPASKNIDFKLKLTVEGKAKDK